MPYLQVILLALAAFGHLSFCVATMNRMHAVGFPRRITGTLSICGWATLIVMPAGLFHPEFGNALSAIAAGHPLQLVYLVPCWAMAVFTIAHWAHAAITHPDRTSLLLSDHTRIIDLAPRLQPREDGKPAAPRIARLPGNQALSLSIHTKHIQLPRMAPALDGLSIAHLTDLHMSGRIPRDFFEELVDATLDLKPDCIAITGDLFDTNECIEWIDATLARLTAPYGVFFILGNHDLRVDARRARGLLAEAGLVDLGGSWRVVTARGLPLLLAGNELPWITPAADLSDFHEPAGATRALRILLSHSPDQIDWARAGDFDLMLAGHTHGGQIRLPLVGPVLSPSRQGTRYAAGTFYCEPTLMHVSRGVSSLVPLRINCRPELALLVLRSASVTAEEPAPQELGYAVP